MFNLSKLIKSVIEKRSKKYMDEAEETCKEARILIKKSIEENNNSIFIEGIETYFKVITINPKNVEPYLVLAFIFWKLGETTQAVMLLNKASEFEIENEFLHKMLNKIKIEHRKKEILEQSLISLNNNEPINKKISTYIDENFSSISNIFEVFSFIDGMDETESKPVKKKTNHFNENEESAQSTKNTSIDAEKLKELQKIKDNLNKSTLKMKVNNNILSKFSKNI